MSSIFTFTWERAILAGSVAILLGIHCALAMISDPGPLLSALTLINFICLLSLILICFIAAILGGSGEEKATGRKRGEHEAPTSSSWFFSPWGR